MNFEKKKLAYRTLTEELAWINSFIESLEQEKRNWQIKMDHWQAKRKECIEKIIELG
jgi:hypothetical protein